MQGPLNSKFLLWVQKRACNKKANKLSVPKSSKLERKLEVGGYKNVGSGEPRKRLLFLDEKLQGYAYFPQKFYE